MLKILRSSEYKQGIVYELKLRNNDYIKGIKQRKSVTYLCIRNILHLTKLKIKNRESYRKS